MEAYNKAKERSELVRQLEDQAWYELEVKPWKDLPIKPKGQPYINMHSATSLQAYATTQTGSLRPGIEQIIDAISESFVREGRQNRVKTKIQRYFWGDAPQEIQDDYLDCHDNLKQSKRGWGSRIPRQLKSLNQGLTEIGLEGFSDTLLEDAESLSRRPHHAHQDIPSFLTWFYDAEAYQERQEKLRHNRELDDVAQFVTQAIYDKVWQTGYEIRTHLAENTT